MKRLTEFLTKCRQQLKNEQNLFWVSLQSNLLADLSDVEQDFQKAVQEMKEEMKGNGWILPTFSANMRNQVNIANVQIELHNMQSSITKLKSGTSLIGELPILFKVDTFDWNKKKYKVLKHCIELMSQNSEKNIVVLWDDCSKFGDVADDIKRVIKDKKVVAYPSKQSKEKGMLSTIASKLFPSKQSKEKEILNVKQFVEKSDHILVTRNQYFNGCESANVIILTNSILGTRNIVLRGVHNIICVQLYPTSYYPKKGKFNSSSVLDHISEYNPKARMYGMKEDNRFL